MADERTTEVPPCSWMVEVCYSDCWRRHLCMKERRERQIEQRGGMREEWMTAMDAERVSETTSPSVGSYRDRDIPAWVDCPERGGRFLYVGIAFEDQEGSIVLSQLAEDEIVVSPGLIYRRS